MGPEGSEDAKEFQFDPFHEWIQFWEGWTKAWSGPMSDAVASKGFAESMGQQLEGTMEAAAMMRRQMSGVMRQVLQQMSLPARQDVVRLAERLTNVEMRLDDVDAKTDQILRLLQAAKDRQGDASSGGQ